MRVDCDQEGGKGGEAEGGEVATASALGRRQEQDSRSNRDSSRQHALWMASLSDSQWAETMRMPLRPPGKASCARWIARPVLAHCLNAACLVSNSVGGPWSVEQKRSVGQRQPGQAAAWEGEGGTHAVRDEEDGRPGGGDGDGGGGRGGHGRGGGRRSGWRAEEVRELGLEGEGGDEDEDGDGEREEERRAVAGGGGCRGRAGEGGVGGGRGHESCRGRWEGGGERAREPSSERGLALCTGWARCVCCCRAWVVRVSKAGRSVVCSAGRMAAGGERSRELRQADEPTLGTRPRPRFCLRTAAPALWLGQDARPAVACMLVG